MEKRYIEGRIFAEKNFQQTVIENYEFADCDFENCKFEECKMDVFSKAVDLTTVP